MHGDPSAATLRNDAAPPTDRSRARRAGATAALVGAVVLVHLWLLHATAPRAGAGTATPMARQTPSVQVRQVPLPEPTTRTAGETARAAVASASPAPERQQAGPPRQPAAAGAVALRRAGRTPAAASPPLIAPRDALDRRSEAVDRDAAAPLADPAAERPTVDDGPLASRSRAAVGRRDASADAALVDEPSAQPASELAAIDDAVAPVYPTRIPPPAQLRYALLRGAAEGSALIDWRADAERYELSLQATLPGGAQIDQRSVGAFDAAGLAPQRLLDRRRGRSAQAANFERDQHRVRFSGVRFEVPLPPGAQDRLSWMVQLSAIGAAGGLEEGGSVSLPVIGARGASARWRFVVMSSSGETLSAQESSAVRLVREPQHLYDLRIEVWLAPSRGWWPVRLRHTQVPGGEPTEWRLVE